MATRKGGLGKGLEALFVENETDEITPSTLKIGEIEPNRGQPRHDFDETALAELADSIREHGVLQPLLVRPMPNGKYQIVAGERRWRASRMAGLTELPVIIRDLDEAAAMEVALIENLQRSDLNPMEEAMGYQELMQQHGYTQEQVAKRVGKSRPAVANAVRLLELSEKYVSPNDLTSKVFTKKDGASLLAQMLFEEATSVHFYVGQSINAAHQGLPIDITMKLKLVESLAANLKKMGKTVQIDYD